MPREVKELAQDRASSSGSRNETLTVWLITNEPMSAMNKFISPRDQSQSPNVRIFRNLL